MEIIHLLRRWRSTYKAYKNARKYAKLAHLKTLLNEYANLKSVVLTKDALILQLQNNAKFEWDFKKPNSFLMVVNENYEALERNLIKEILTAEDTVFDIGANFGYFSVLMKKFCPKILLYSFEPIKSTYCTLLRNLEHNLIDVKAYNFGFSNQPGAVTFYIPDQLGDAWASMGTGVSSVFNYKLKEEIGEVQRLDDFVAENNIHKIDFIKCDVEGAEKLVVEGAMQTLKKHQPTLMLEIGNMWTAAFGYNREILLRLMIEEFDYRCFGILANVVIEITDLKTIHKYPEEQMYNYFFVHPSKSAVMSLMLRYIEKV